MGSALGQAHWPPPQAGATSGRWPTVPGVTHLIACAQVGPIRTPGGPPNPRGRVPHQRLLRALVTPPPPPVRCGIGPCLLAFVPRGVPLSRAPCRDSWLPPCPVCPCCLPLLWRVGVLCCLFFFSFFFFARLSSLPPGFRSVMCPPPCPLAVSSLSSPFSWVGGGEGGGGGGRPHCPSSGVSTSQARRRHEARHLSLCWGGGACRVAPVVTLPFLRSHPRWSPRWGLHGACSLWARSCGSSRTLFPLPPHPAAVSSRGWSASRYRHPPCRPCRLPFVARMRQA